MKRLFPPLYHGLVLLALSFASTCPDLWAESPEAPNFFNNLQGDAWVHANLEAAERHFACWKAATGKLRGAEADLVNFYAWRAERPDMMAQVLADGRLDETEVKVPLPGDTVKVETVYEVPKDRGEYNTSMPVWRRITKSAFEVWTPNEGCLFDAKGNRLATAHPQRDNAQGREWFGAFLPDGRWITTELHERDDRLYIFNRQGRCTKEIKSVTLPRRKELDTDEYHTPIIPWARSNKDGDAWLLLIGSEGGDGELLLQPDGTCRLLKQKESLWKQCLARQLGVRLSGGISFYINGSDDGECRMTSAQPSHGTGVGNPEYDIAGPNGGSLGRIPSDGHVFGFWPWSHASQVFAGDRTWLFDATTHYQGWIAGQRAGDASDRKSMLFCMDDGRVATVSPKLQVTRVQKFVRADGILLMPLELHPDIGLGIFLQRPPGKATDERAVRTNSPWIGLGRWSVEKGK